MLSKTGDMLSGFGFATEEALRLSGQVNKLAIDLSSFANVPVEQAADALTKGLIGEREAMKSLGIAILETDIKARLAAKGKDKLTGAALRQAKAQVTMQLALEQSKNAIGDFQRSSGGSLANQFRILSANVVDFATKIGAVFLPAVLSATKAINRLFQSDAEVATDGLAESHSEYLNAIEKIAELETNKKKGEQSGDSVAVKRIESEIAAEKKYASILKEGLEIARESALEKSNILNEEIRALEKTGVTAENLRKKIARNRNEIKKLKNQKSSNPSKFNSYEGVDEFGGFTGNDKLAEVKNNLKRYQTQLEDLTEKQKQLNASNKQLDKTSAAPV